jgi:methylaspartate ammonia-lyase
VRTDGVHIADVIFAPGQGAFYYDDQAAIKAGATRDGHFYEGVPRTPGFRQIRMPASTLGIGLVLSDCTVCWGDMMTVQYSAAGGREPLFDGEALQDRLRAECMLDLLGLELVSFRGSAQRLLDGPACGGDLPSSAKYGLTQALLAATATAKGCSMAELVSHEYGFPLQARPVPIFCQSGEDRQANVDKMILRKANALPHGLINNSALIGPEGATLCDYVQQVRGRVLTRGASGYRPILHFDVYGGIGEVFGRDIERIVGFLCQLEAIAAPLSLRIESPVDFGSRVEQVSGFAEIRRRLKEQGSTIQLIADEWCNTLQDLEKFLAAEAADLVQLKMPDMGSLHDTIVGIQRCRDAGIGVYLGGSCAETDLSARVSVHVAVAAQVDVMLAKPGMGVDEGHMIVANEQARLLAWLHLAMSGQEKMGIAGPQRLIFSE